MTPQIEEIIKTLREHSWKSPREVDQFFRESLKAVEHSAFLAGLRSAKEEIVHCSGCEGDGAYCSELTQDAIEAKITELNQQPHEPHQF